MSENTTCTVDEARARVEASKARSAWERGVKEYAMELLQDLDGSEALDLGTLEKRLLNGADDWQHYSEGASALVYDEDIAGKFDYKLTDTFMGFHCGNTPSCKMCGGCAVKYQLIQNRLLENGGTPDFTRGTLEGDIAPGAITFYRLQCDSEGVLRSYIAQGEVLPVATRSFGGIGIFAIPEMGRFYRHVLIQKRYPHHGAVAFAHCGKALFEVLKYFGVSDIAYNLPKSLPYPTENPWG